MNNAQVKSSLKQNEMTPTQVIQESIQRHLSKGLTALFVISFSLFLESLNGLFIAIVSIFVFYQFVAKNQIEKDNKLKKLYTAKKFYQDVKKAEKSTCHNIVILDIDNFKKVNDKYGHDVGDKVLLDLSHLLLYQTRKTDRVYRFGGEEICIISKGTVNETIKMAERIRKNVESTRLGGLNITVSCGISTIEKGKNSFIIADEALYLAKKNGKNQICYK